MCSSDLSQVGTIGSASQQVDLFVEDLEIGDTVNGASVSGAAADEALVSDGSGGLQFAQAGGVEEVSTFGNLPAIDPPQLAYVTGEQEYYYSRPLTGTPFDIQSATFSTSINTLDDNSFDIEWNDDGSRLYEVGSNGENINQYTVSTPYDITSASFQTSINTQAQFPRGMAWNDNGSRLYEVGEGPGKIYQYTVSTPYDITSASFQTSINTQDAAPFGIAWNDDGSRLYEVDKNEDQIYQYDLVSGGWEVF